MSKLDSIKETIAYLKFWLGVMIVSDVSLVGWLLSNALDSSLLKVFSALFIVVTITLAASFMHKKIARLIATLREL